MILDLLTAALRLASNPFALAGYILLGVYSQTLWQALKYGFLWGAAIFIFSVALGASQLSDMQSLAIRFGLTLAGALIVTVGVFYLYRALRRRQGPGGGSGGGRGRGNGAGRPPPRLRRVK